MPSLIDQSAVNGLSTSLAAKADAAATTTALAAKADAAATTTALAAKADASALLVGWHPYNKTAVADANDGLIWSFAANGAVAEVVTPNFVDGYEYMILLNKVMSSSSTGNNMLIELYRATSAAYAGTGVVLGSVSSVFPCSGMIEILAPRIAMKHHYVVPRVLADASNATSTVAVAGNIITTHTTAQKITRARLTIASVNISGTGSDGAIYLYRRRFIT